MDGRTCCRIYDGGLHEAGVKGGGDRCKVAQWADLNRDFSNDADIRRLCFYQGPTGQTRQSCRGKLFERRRFQNDMAAQFDCLKKW